MIIDGRLVFFPDDFKPYKADVDNRLVPEERPKKPSLFNFVAPEHVRIALSMGRDFPKDDRGNKLPGTSKELVVDRRPNILVPPGPTRTLVI